jgi:hypothetical protein
MKGSFGSSFLFNLLKMKMDIICKVLKTINKDNLNKKYPLGNFLYFIIFYI